MRDVALAAKVSVTTVSHVVNGTRAVLPETERAVREALQRTGYITDSVARSMRTGRTHTIGLAMSAISNPYFGQVVHAVERQLTARGYTLLLADTHDEPDREARAVQDLLSHRPAGLILAPSARPDETIKQIAARQIPLVSIDRVIPDVDSVGVENSAPTATLVKHLAALGHRQIALVAGRFGLATSEERIAGYRQGMRDVGLPVGRSLTLAGDSTDEGARTAVLAALQRRNPPTALVIGNNVMTIGTMRALRELQILVPQDLALATFDDFEWSDLFSPRLTTMAQPIDKLATAAIDLLMRRMDNLDGEPQQIRFDPTFIHRDSCGCDGG